jgi:hypothetical protein
MKSIWNESDRNEIVARIERVADESKPQWGKFTPDRMLSHISQSLRMATGELATKPKRLPIRYFPLKQLIIYLLPFPKGTPTAPELLAGPEAPVATLKPELKRQLTHFATLPGSSHSWPEHPAFGHLTEQAWGVLVYRHLDHHLRQFGV